MTQSFRGGTSLHTLITDASTLHLARWLHALDPALDLPLPDPSDAAAWRATTLERFAELAPDRAKRLDDGATRVLTLARERGPETLRRIAEVRLSEADFATFEAQPDALAKSIWTYLDAPQVFADAESFHHARRFRDYAPIFSAFDAPVGKKLAWTAAMEQRLQQRILAELKLTPPIRLCHLELLDEGSPCHVIIVRHGGPLSSVAAHGEDGSKDWLYYRPATEATLVYSPERGSVEVLAESPSVRQDLALAFAEEGLGEDLSCKPLSFKLYDMTRFRRSLLLPHFEPEGFRVERVSVVEAEVCLSPEGRGLTLKVNPDDDIEGVADGTFDERPVLRRYPVVRVTISVRYWPKSGGRLRSFNFVLSQPNRCNLRSQKDPELRRLGYELLEHWGVLQSIRTLGPDDRRTLLPALLALYDLGEAVLTEHELNQRGFDVQAFAGHAFLEPAGRIGVMVIDADEGGPELVEMGIGLGNTGAFEDGTGRQAWQARALVTRYRVNRDWVQETILKELLPSVTSRPVQTSVPELLLLGELTLGEARVPCHLARGLSNPRVARRAEEYLRGCSPGGYGLILDAGRSGIGYLGPNVVVPIADYLSADAGRDALDLDQLRLTFEANRLRALNGTSVELISNGAVATLYIPGRPPLSLTGEKQIRIIDRLVKAQRSGTPLVQTSELLAGTGSTALSQSFRGRWSEIENSYLISRTKGYWQLAA